MRRQAPRARRAFKIFLGVTALLRRLLAATTSRSCLTGNALTVAQRACEQGTPVAPAGPMRVGVFRGDGTGPEVTNEALKVLAAVRTDVSASFSPARTRCSRVRCRLRKLRV